jgi:small subunit ribosomal protein S17
MTENTQTEVTTAPKAETTPAPAASKPDSDRGTPKSRIGVVLSNKMTKTVVVEVERRMKHGQYGKYLTVKKKYKAHDETNACKIGDRVRIAETRPMSKEKRWRVSEILVKGEAHAAPAPAAPAPAAEMV